MSCLVCGADRVSSGADDLVYEFRGRTTVIRDVRGDRCGDCGEVVLGPDEAARVSGEMLEFNASVSSSES
ncbi:type II toxin-antitoxin system MqsA family antitoxin [Pararhizobium sp. BT-229]|uniref:type II toxin-antitoxin system MqsA family antitoxin n=1 Tax=Pararhizobium sp. BT-229 TaxID=2986923 RepID=UPI0021F726AE|nr:type II toxin-antitoxin system MqsA family antitoxin [Pararhizobium sp. BT-229]MCV9964016.1 type II toxin-antitoxin system MqsA family antitoxin [Pararhizobium sp. BT-229]